MGISLLALFIDNKNKALVIESEERPDNTTLQGLAKLVVFVSLCFTINYFFEIV